MTSLPRVSRRRLLAALGPLAAGAFGGGLLGHHPPRQSVALSAVVERSTTTELGDILQTALDELRTAVATGGTVPPEAGRRIGDLIGGRLWHLATSRGDLGQASHFGPLGRLLGLVAEAQARTLPSGSATQTALDRIYAQLGEALDRSARGVTSIGFPAARRPGERQILVTGFDPFTNAGWNPSGAAALALAGTTLPLGDGGLVRVAGLVLPVDYRRFAQGMVEAAIGPHLPTLDAIVTVSMEPRFRNQLALERYAVNFHWVDPPLPATATNPAVVTGPIPVPPPAGEQPMPPGPAVLPTWRRVEELTAPARPGGLETFVRSSLTLHFASAVAVVTAVGDLGAPGVRMLAAQTDLTLADAPLITRLLSAQMPPANSPGNRVTWHARRGRGRLFAAEVIAGPGGNFLSNEVSYRVLRLIRQAGPATQAVSFHIHTPNAPSASDPSALVVRDRVIAEVRRIVVDCASRL